MKFILSTFLALLGFTISYGQNEIFPCGKHNLHTVNHSYLFKQVGEDLPITYNPPKYKGGQKEILNFFKIDPVDPELAKNELVVNLYVSFLVNCQGKVGNFSLLNEVDPEVLPLAEAVICRLEELPEDWAPATSRRKSVDSYQVVEFTFVQGDVQRIVIN